MTELQQTVMKRLYGLDIWRDFAPDPSAGEVQGWNGDHPSLARLVGIGDPALVIDVGVWKGQSTIAMALEMKRNGLDGCVIAVDTFLGSTEHWDMNLFDRDHGLPDLYRTFLSNVWHSDVAEYVVPLPQTSGTAATILGRLGIEASVAHVDAAHEYAEVLRDAEAYWRLLRPGGYLVGDDYDRTWPGVVRAAADFSSAHCVPLAIEHPKWIAQKE